MRNAAQYLLVVSSLFALMTGRTEVKTQSPPDREKAGIDKIAQLSAKEHSTILFTIADCSIGYAKNGDVRWIQSSGQCGSGNCSWPHPSLSHDGSRVAFVTGSNMPKHCDIVIHDMSNGLQRELIETANDPGEISWSWDDTEIAFFDHGISAISVGDRTMRVLLPYPIGKIGGHEFTFGTWYPMQGLHNGKDLAVELNAEIPTKTSGEYHQQSNLLLVSGAVARVLDIGSQPSVSPITDWIAYYTSAGVTAINPDGTGKALLTKVPGDMLFSKADELFSRIVWSPDGSRLFFGTIVSENRRDDLYLLDVKSGRREQFLSHTSITVRGWH
jgi:hypothetical protein